MIAKPFFFSPFKVIYLHSYKEIWDENSVFTNDRIIFSIITATISTTTTSTMNSSVHMLYELFGAHVVWTLPCTCCMNSSVHMLYELFRAHVVWTLLLRLKDGRTSQLIRVQGDACWRLKRICPSCVSLLGWLLLPL